MLAPMMRNWKKALWILFPVPFVVLAVWLSRLDRGLEMQLDARQGEPLRVVVTDPLSRELVRDDLKDLQRDYAPLGAFLEKALGRRVEIRYGAGLPDLSQSGELPDLIFGRDPTMRAGADPAQEPARPILRLTDDSGATDISGVFIVRANDPARTIHDLGEHRFVFGPAGDEERHSWALAALSQAGTTPVPPLQVATTCREALQVLARQQADATVISSYVLALLEGADAAERKAFRVVGRTAPRPFITAFATSRVSPSMERVLTEALLSLRAHPPLLAALRSKAGFVPLQGKPVAKAPPAPLPVAAWTDWRGPGRAGWSPEVPEKLPATVKFLWKRGLTGAGLSGVAATAAHVIVADKSEQKDQDIWRCLDADTGQELWTIAYVTPKQMEFTNAPRATPVIHGSFVYLLGAFGDLHCVNLYGSGIVWRRNILQDFDAKLPSWGTCSTPLVVGDSLVVNPGAAEASLVALGLYTGEVIWKTPGASPAYASLILGTFGGVRQIVGHDAESLGGWDPNTGQRLWTVLPDKKDDHGDAQRRCGAVPTPVNVAGRLLVATADHGTRLYDFEPNGRIRPLPIAQTRDLAPDISTPVIVNELIYGCAGGLRCLDLTDNLKTLYAAEQDGAFREYAALIAGPGRLLAVTVRGELILFQAARDLFTPISRLRVFRDTELWSHPALVGNRLYLRSMNEICCLLLDN
jgi:ABC-type phosphate/phosphonate transport system substrate-binding protein/outer membrane protein assembly factor BamB